MLPRPLDVATSVGASAARLFLGAWVGTLGPRPERPLELYEFESCPFCRKVREALTILDLETYVYPCPKGGSRFRDEALRWGGKAIFPWFHDPNTGVRMYESSDIVRYLFAKYGTGSVPLLLRLGPLTVAQSTLASAWRPVSGLRAVPSKRPDQPLELWSFEASPFSRIAREALCELELPYLLHNVAHGSPSRDAFVRRSGKMQVPYLADPNTGKAMFESADIVRYLHATYGA
jgi:glutathione S-transferase